MEKQQHSNLLEQTLILLKPDALDRGIVGEIIARFERAGLKLVGMKLLVSEKDTAMRHYTEDLARRRGERVRELMIDMITSGPIMAIVLEGIDVIEVVRKIVGATEPKSALPGTIRGDYAHMSYSHADSHGVGIPNLVHASSDTKEAKAEIEHWFGPEELFDYPLAHGHFTLTDKKSTAKK